MKISKTKSSSNSDRHNIKYVVLDANVENLQRQNKNMQKSMLVFIVVSAFAVMLLYRSTTNTKLHFNKNIIDDISITNSKSFLIFNKKCSIDNRPHFGKDIKPFYRKLKYFGCRSFALLTSLRNINDTITLTVNKEEIKHYTDNELSCCYSDVERVVKWIDPDCCVNISACSNFTNQTKTKSPIVMVTCEDATTKKQIYKNVHSVVKLTKEVEAKMQTMEYPKTHQKRPLNVLFVGIDGVSRLNLMRSMPKTRSFLIGQDWIELKGYNKIGDNTFPNLMAIFTGKKSEVAYQDCQPMKPGGLNRCKMIWHSYEKFGYVTAYCEDETWLSTFNYRKRGFSKQPTDYYCRPYFLAAHKLKTKTISSSTYCTGPEVSGERVMNVARDFTSFFKSYPYIGIFWMNSFSHNDVNGPSRMDSKVLQFLNDVKEAGTLENTMVIFLSDHGMRFGKIRFTQSGWYEERLPFFFISLPKWFAAEYPEQYKNLRINTGRLTTPYDLHMTLQDLLVFTGFNHTVVPGSACPTCSSLFGPIVRDRSCEDAAIPSHWCTCKSLTDVQKNTLLVNQTIKFVMDYMQTKILKNNPKCAKFSLKRIIYAKESHESKKSHKTTLVVDFETEPEAFFEATVNSWAVANLTRFEFDGDISRLDFYKGQSGCLDDSVLEKYCYCKDKLKSDGKTPIVSELTDDE